MAVVAHLEWVDEVRIHGHHGFDATVLHHVVHGPMMPPVSNNATQLKAQGSVA
jgi:hypothetical protein